MGTQASEVPAKAWVVTFAGMACNLCLGILYAWSVWKGVLIGGKLGDPIVIKGVVQEGWVYLTDAQATVAYTVCGLVFAVFMIPGGRIQDKYGPKFGATLGGLLLAVGCIVAGLMHSFTGLIIGYGILGGIGMGIGYAAPTPAALKWFGPHKRGMIAGIVVAGYGAAALYIAPLGQFLIDNYGLSASFIYLGIFFAVVVVIAGQFLSNPPAGYVPPAAPVSAGAPAKAATATADWAPSEMLGKWQFYALVLLFIGSAQSGLLIIGNAAPILGKTAKAVPFLAANIWIIASFGGLMNALGRIGTGMYSDKIGRRNAYLVNGIISAICLLALPHIIDAQSVPLLFLAVAIAYWQYGGGLSLLPTFTADFFGSKHMGANYGFVFLGWGLGFLMPLLAGYIKDWTHSYTTSLYISATILIVAVILCAITKKPVKE
ncbi:MAG: OFA family MFS transporter [Desulfobulbaceae bacterium]|jgi:MFS family permease|nr:OFA family MFS transporter [Desulfobulbaceae bacterium]